MNKSSFTTIRTEGGLLPSDLLQRIASGAKELDGLAPADYHLGSGERLNEAISRSWNRLLGVWAGFSEARGKLPENDLGTSLTRERWLLILFQELGYGRLTAPDKTNTVIDGKGYPISHIWQNAPIHLVGFRVDLDRRMPGVAGAARSSPHGLVQEFLNRTEKHLWGFLSNGLRLRILRDNISLTRQSYVEFDLEGMMDGEVYADFALLWLLCHQSRVEGEKPEQCWLEKWAHTAQEQGTRALDHLRDGVEQAIKSLGSGFLAHPANKDLRDRLRSGALNTQDYYRQLVRLVYRMIFLFVAEDRGLLFDPKAPPAARDRYMAFYSTARLRRLAERRRGTKHPDLFRTLRLVMERLGHDMGCPDLALPALGSFLWSAEAIGNLGPCDIANLDFLDSLRALAFTREGNIRRAVDYHNLGSEELGSVYESLLEMHPQINADAATFDLKVAAGHERKTTGSYYTHSSLVQCLLDSALDPVLDEAARKPNPEQAILSLKVCDPASGSGHFLIAAAHRMAKRLASVRTGDEEPSPEAIRQALRDVIGHCVYGVDINPMSVELCKVSLWMEALEPGKPLSFLDAHILCGNSLLGATPALLRKGIPNEAFEPIEGDDKELCAGYRKQNKRERAGQKSLFDVSGQLWDRLGDLPGSIGTVEAIDDSSIEGIRRKQQTYEQVVRSAGYLYGKFWADAWCAAFVWKKVRNDAVPYAITEEVFRNIEKTPHSAAPWLREEVARLAAQYQFFHWHIAFPNVFRIDVQDTEPDKIQSGWNGGFDVVLGNPPWERLNISQKEWFASLAPDVANAQNSAARGQAIAQLAVDSPTLWSAWQEALRMADGTSHIIRNGGCYPLCGCGDINTYAVFGELYQTIVGKVGRAGFIVPGGIAMDATTQHFFSRLVESRVLASLYHFENEAKLFPGVHHALRFCLLTITGKERPVSVARFVAYVRSVTEMQKSDRTYELSADDFQLINPNTRSFPAFRSRRDAELTKYIYGRVPVLLRQHDRNGNPWRLELRRMMHMSDDIDLFRTREQLEAGGFRREGNMFLRESTRMLPLFEAKMVHQFDHRFGTYEGQTEAQANQGKLPETTLEQHASPHTTVLPRYWVDEIEVDAKLEGQWDHDWLLGWRDITGAENTRTVVTSLIPRVAVSGFHQVFSKCSPDLAAILCAILNSFIHDYVARQKIGGKHLTYGTLEQMPVLSPTICTDACLWSSATTNRVWLLPRILELAYSAWDMQPLAKDCGYSGPPLRWSEQRRFVLRCELDAAFFHLYLGAEEEWKRRGMPELLRHFPTPRHAVDYIMSTFPIVKRKDEQTHGGYRTKDTILKIYDEMARVMAENATAITAGRQQTERYQTRLNPPPGPPCDAQGNFIPMSQWDRTDWPANIHLSREAEVLVPEEVPVAAFAAMAYPATDTDRAICAAALSAVAQSGGLSSMDHLDALLLATHPDWCKTFLGQRDQAAFDAARQSALVALFVSQSQSIRWKDCRDYLEQRNALTVAHGGKGQPISAGADLSSVQATLPVGISASVEYALKALERIRELRRDLSSVPQAQQNILGIFEGQHREYKLVA